MVAAGYFCYQTISETHYISFLHTEYPFHLQWDLYKIIQCPKITLSNGAVGFHNIAQQICCVHVGPALIIITNTKEKDAVITCSVLSKCIWMYQLLEKNVVGKILTNRGPSSWNTISYPKLPAFKFVQEGGSPEFSLISASSQGASYQIRKIAGCACAGSAGNISPCRRIQRKPRVSDAGMHHSTWCMSGLLTRGGGENVPGIPSACAPAIWRIWQEAHANVMAVKVSKSLKNLDATIDLNCNHGNSLPLTSQWLLCYQIFRYPNPILGNPFTDKD